MNFAAIVCSHSNRKRNTVERFVCIGFVARKPDRYLSKRSLEFRLV